MSFAIIEARIDGGMDWEGADLDDTFVMSGFDVATLQHHVVDASRKMWGMTVICPGQVDVASFLVT